MFSKAGLGSRTEARSWIGAGRVTLNGKKVQSPDLWVDPERDHVTVDGRRSDCARENLFAALQTQGLPDDLQGSRRPSDGVRSPREIGQGSDEQQWIFPVGRLDQDTTGLLILTNDTEFGDYITSPASKVPKTYLVKASTLLSEDQLDQLRRGIALSDGMTAPALVERIRDSARYTFFEITITEGRNRQVRRMVEALSAKVLKLVRTCIGPVRIGTLEIGKYRALTQREVSLLAK